MLLDSDSVLRRLAITYPCVLTRKMLQDRAVVYNAGVGAGRAYALPGVLRWFRVVCWMMAGFRGLGCGGLSAWGWRGWRSGGMRLMR